MFSARHGARVLAAPMFPPVDGGAGARWQQSVDFAPDCARVTAPTLVVTGEDALDRVVPADVTRRYLTLIPGARYVKIERTGHIGMLTRPSEFAEIVAGSWNRLETQGSGHASGAQGLRSDAGPDLASVEP